MDFQGCSAVPGFASEAFVGALKAVDRAGLFGRGAERAFLTVNVLCEHPSPAFFRRGLAIRTRVTMAMY